MKHGTEQAVVTIIKTSIKQGKLVSTVRGEQCGDGQPGAPCCRRYRPPAAAFFEQIALDIASPLLEEPGALLPILHALQDHFRYIPAEVVPPGGAAAKPFPGGSSRCH